MTGTEKKIQQMLFANQDLDYRTFQCRLMPTVNPDTVIGVRTPVLRKLAREISQWPEAAQFLNTLPHRYYEENNLHAFCIAQCKCYDETIAALERFLPHVDNWATCDMMRPKVFREHLPELLIKIRQWLAAEHTYTVRFGIGMLMCFYLDDSFVPEYLALVAGIQTTQYYVKMMIAWYFATALAKQYEAAVPYFQTQHLEQWTHNKAIQKAIESSRISAERKVYLRTLKR